MAPSDRGLPSGIMARPLRETDLPAALALSREAGWNQTVADWRIFLDLGNVICLARDGQAPIATAAMLPFGASFAWISMVLVTATERRQGLAQWLLQRCLDELVARNLVPVLDATPAGRTVYVGLGFEDCWSMRRLICSTPIHAPSSAAASVRPIEERDWPKILAYDKTVFGAERESLLRRLAQRLPQAALVAEQRGRLAGVLFGRDGRVMSQLGPLLAEDDATARALLSQAMAAIPPPLAIDVPDLHAAVAAWLGSLGFVAERPLTRMTYRRCTAFDDTGRLFAIAGPELG